MLELLFFVYIVCSLLGIASQYWVLSDSATKRERDEQLDDNDGEVATFIFE